MAIKLADIVGLNDSIIKKLSEKAGINDVAALANATNTPSKRSELAVKIGEPVFLVYAIAKQAELLRCEKVTASDADKLVRAGVRSIADLKEADPEKLADFLFFQGIDSEQDEYGALEWVMAAFSVDSSFQPDASDQPNPELYRDRSVSSMTRSSAYGSDLSEIITELGIGIAQAQRQLDEASLGIQREILSDPELSSYGFNATWYAIPEASFTLKMEYTYSETGERRISVVPMNAAYNNVFKTERSEESTLNIRFVPVPAPDALTLRAKVPSFLSMTVTEAAEAAAQAGLSVKFLFATGEAANGKYSEIIAQSMPEGSVGSSLQTIKLTYRSSEKRELAGRLISALRDYAQNLNRKGDYR